VGRIELAIGGPQMISAD